jgi:hypothetical protein
MIQVFTIMGRGVRHTAWRWHKPILGKQDNNIKMDSKGIVGKGVDYIHLVQAPEARCFELSVYIKGPEFFFLVSERLLASSLYINTSFRETSSPPAIDLSAGVWDS